MRHLKIKILIVLTMICTNVFGQIDDENEIISASIKSYFKTSPNDTVYTRKGKIKQIMIHRRPEILLVTETYPMILDPEDDSSFSFKELKLSAPSIDSLTYLDFIDKNKTSIQIDSIFGFQGTISYTSRQEIDNIFEHGSWENYRKVYGYNKFLVEVSRPGFNRDMSKAFIYFRNSIDGLAGFGYYFILEKIDGKWIVKETIMLWRS